MYQQRILIRADANAESVPQGNKLRQKKAFLHFRNYLMIFQSIGLLDGATIRLSKIINPLPKI